MYFCTPGFCPLMVLVFRQNLNLPAGFFSWEKANGDNIIPVVARPTVFSASRLFILDCDLFDLIDNMIWR